MINKKRLIKTFKQLVRIDSPSLKEKVAMGFLEKEMKKLGYTVSFAGKPKGGEIANMIVAVPGRGIDSPTILLNAHIDTVTHDEPIRPIEKKDYIITNGNTILGADNKAGVAAILEILKILKEKKLKHPPIQVVFTVAEEIGLRGAAVLPKGTISADFGLILDGGDMDKIIYQAPTQYNIKAKIIGKAAHAGIHPEAGINAIKVAAAAIFKMKLGRIDKETTANIGLIKGGKATNIVPEKVELRGEARSHNLKKLKKQTKHMNRVIIVAAAKYKARAEIEIKRVYQSFQIKKSSEVLQLALREAKKAKVKPQLVKTGGGSDANIFNELGIPSIILGVGADNVHTTSERLLLKDFIKGTEIVLNIIRESAK